MSSTSKLLELRRKTDRELRGTIQRELERGLALATVAATRMSPLHLQADKIYTEVKTLLPTLDGLDQRGRGQMESRLRELRAALDRTPAKAIPRQMTCSAQGD